MFNTQSLLGLSIPTWKVFTDIINYLPHIRKVEADKPHGSWRITIVQNECKTKLTYHVIECIS